jgi:hypothetical protein
MDMFLDHKVQENALGKLTAVKKKEKRRKTGLVKKAGGARIYAVIMTITDHRWVRDRARVSSMDTPLMKMLLSHLLRPPLLLLPGRPTIKRHLLVLLL